MSTEVHSLIEARVRRRERRRSFTVFFSIVLAVYSLINLYLFSHLLAAIPENSISHSVLILLFIFIAASFIAGELLEHKRSTIFGRTLAWIGAFWLGAMAWLFLAFVLVDIARLTFGWFGVRVLSGAKGTQWTAGTISIVTGVFLIIGFLNARRIRIKPLSISLGKPSLRLRIAAVSDMHMGSLIGRKMVRQMVQKINSIQPDLILMVGDQVDGNPHPVMQLDLGRELKEIKSKYGVFAITGNHEYIGNAETSCAYLEAHGITMLRDAVTEVAGIYLVGREDIAAKQFAHYERKSLDELLSSLDRSKPLILLDHTPFHLEDAEQHGIDLQLSGHTHHAQLWPFSYITKRIYEVSWGYKLKGNTHVYVSCGAGTWGPPIRMGNTPEIMNITFGG